VVGNGGTTVVGNGGTTVVGNGGTTVVGNGGTTAAGGSVMQLGPNLVSNGDFSLGANYWHVTDSTGYSMSTGSVTAGSYCIVYSSTYYSQVIGWPIVVANALTLKANTKYGFSYRIQGPATTRVAAKVGLFATPYTAIFPTTTTDPTSMLLATTWQEFGYSFTTSSTLNTTAAIGIAFTVTNFSSGQVCIDDVTLAEFLG
jgi:hypothetical protein